MIIQVTTRTIKLTSGRVVHKDPRADRTLVYSTEGRKAYENFCEAHPEVDVETKKWREVLYTHNRLFAEYMMETGDRAKLRWLGTFAIGKRKVRKFGQKNGKQIVTLPIDWVKTKAAGKYVYNFNTHSDGYRFRWVWYRIDARFETSELWAFRPDRKISRGIVKYINRGPEQYEKYRNWQYYR